LPRRQPKQQGSERIDKCQIHNSPVVFQVWQQPCCWQGCCHLGGKVHAMVSGISFFSASEPRESPDRSQRSPAREGPIRLIDKTRPRVWSEICDSCLLAPALRSAPTEGSERYAPASPSVIVTGGA
jgi:hypothetical protein